MDAIDLMVFRAARDWRSNGHRIVLATVVRTWGSSPRPVGSMRVLHDDGKTVGSVSGGAATAARSRRDSTLFWSGMA
ncbi:XdhC family protein [Paraburkholderia sp. J94]|uniref:XdhC family protein n=1 Tax=Paraburkholderia sp. J94 TaxID=2805441 RepID=UPI002AB1AA0F|nr:XdhC family protein [Paraburkholderia sp. J94]